MREKTAQSALVATARRIGSEVVAKHADASDRDATFPTESLAAMRQAKLMSCYVPVSLGGPGCSMSELAAVSEVLAEYCMSSAMVFAMHQIQVAMLVHHALDAPYMTRYLREVVEKQNLIASMTTEVGVGGEMRKSICAVETHGNGFSFVKETTTMSYGAQADDYLASARRNPDAASNDQVMVLIHRRDATYEQKGSWDTLGLRGTCSPPASLKATGSLEQLMAVPFADSAALTMVPVSHILWASCWLGLAKSALGRAHAVVRQAARAKPGTVPSSAPRLAEANALLQSMRAHIHDALEEYEALRASPDSGAAELSSMRYAVRINNLKLSCSKMLWEVVHQAFAICGIQGFRNDSKYALGRHIRDALAAGVMIGNDRIAGTNAAMLLVLKED